MSKSLQFPSHSVVATYVEHLPWTQNYPSLKEKRVIDVVANFFAGDNRDQVGVYIGAAHVLSDLNKKFQLKIPLSDLGAIQMNLTQVLLCCAEGKPLDIKRQSAL
jgi:hypothetical protein